MVYIQSDRERKLPHHFDCACGLYGALDNSHDIRLTSYEEVESGKFDNIIKSNLFIGSVEFMNLVFSRIGKSVEFMKPYGDFEIKNVEEVIPLIESGEKLFIKPTAIKLFSGMVFDLMTLNILKKLDPKTEVIVQTPFNSRIKSEWRCYVRDGKVIDVRNYSGDFKDIPDFTFAENIVKTIRSPKAFTIDIGLLESRETVVIEFNDMWAIGNYGMDNSDYYRSLLERYFEIVRNV